MTTTLPTLTGSDKQVSWASQIRTDALAALDAYEASERADLALFVAKRGPVGPHVDDYEAGFAKIAEARLRSSTSASCSARCAATAPARPSRRRLPLRFRCPPEQVETPAGCRRVMRALMRPPRWTRGRKPRPP